MIYASILAAGLGARMHRQDMPKQFLLLGEKPIVIHTLEQFFINSSIGRIIIVAPTDWVPYTEDLIAKYNLTGKEFAVIPGGSNKTVSINMSVEFIKKTWGINADDVLVAHDGIRPLVTQRIIDDNIDAARKFGASNTAFLANDMTLGSQDGKFLEEVFRHGQMYAEQTPQSYILPKLAVVFERAAERDFLLESESSLPRLWLNSGETMSLVPSFILAGHSGGGFGSTICLNPTEFCR